MSAQNIGTQVQHRQTQEWDGDVSKTLSIEGFEIEDDFPKLEWVISTMGVIGTG